VRWVLTTDTSGNRATRPMRTGVQGRCEGFLKISQRMHSVFTAVGRWLMQSKASEIEYLAASTTCICMAVNKDGGPGSRQARFIGGAIIQSFFRNGVQYFWHTGFVMSSV
jgi:hypothetical protein